jgi:hypothetical protein
VLFAACCRGFKARRESRYAAAGCRRGGEAVWVCRDCALRQQRVDAEGEDWSVAGLALSGPHVGLADAGRVLLPCGRSPNAAAARLRAVIMDRLAFLSRTGYGDAVSGPGVVKGIECDF